MTVLRIDRTDTTGPRLRKGGLRRRQKNKKLRRIKILLPFCACFSAFFVPNMPTISADTGKPAAPPTPKSRVAVTTKKRSTAPRTTIRRTTRTKTTTSIAVPRRPPLTRPQTLSPTTAATPQPSATVPSSTVPLPTQAVPTLPTTPPTTAARRANEDLPTVGQWVVVTFTGGVGPVGATISLSCDKGGPKLTYAISINVGNIQRESDWAPVGSNGERYAGMNCLVAATISSPTGATVRYQDSNGNDFTDGRVVLRINGTIPENGPVLSDGITILAERVAS